MVLGHSHYANQYFLFKLITVDNWKLSNIITTKGSNAKPPYQEQIIIYREKVLQLIGTSTRASGVYSIAIPC